MAVPNIFGTATAAIPLSQLDTNFATPVTIGNTAVQLGNTVTSFGNVTLTNVTISSGNVTVTSPAIFPAGSNTAPSITTTGDTNTGIFFPAADTIAFSEGGVESMRIDSSGNVGIGTSSPSFSLDIASANANIRVAPSTTTNNALTRYVNAGGTGFVGLDNSVAGLTSAYSLNIYHSGAYPINFSTNATERARIDSSGNVLVTSAAGLGYGTGAGGTVTQATSKSTSVTLNKPTGQITMNNAALAASTNVSFQLTNSLIAITDTLVCSITTAANYSYQIQTYCGAGIAQILLRNIDSVSRSEAIVINFTVIKGATS